MASKLQNIYELSEQVSKELSDYEHWTAFLKSAAWQYKYPFQDQLLIYAQRPDATACASIDVWNKRLKSWINRGSKGIALLREGDRGQYLDYVFDISDTHSLDTLKNLRSFLATSVCEQCGQNKAIVSGTKVDEDFPHTLQRTWSLDPLFLYR